MEGGEAGEGVEEEGEPCTALREVVCEMLWRSIIMIVRYEL